MSYEAASVADNRVLLHAPKAHSADHRYHTFNEQSEATDRMIAYASQR